MNAPAKPPVSIDEMEENFSVLDDVLDRYQYVIELGKALPPLAEGERTDANKVRGCASQVWLVSEVARGAGDEPALVLRGESDAHIVRGLVAILLARLSGRTAQDILSFDAEDLFGRLGLREHLTPQRSNGFYSMVERIRADARAALQAPPTAS